MTKTEIGTIVALVVAIASGALHVGHVNGELEGLNRDAIHAEQAKAIEAIRAEFSAWDTFYDEENARDWSLNVPQGVGVVQEELIRTDEGICFLTGIHGRFEGGGEHVWIEPMGDYWFLRGKSEQLGVRVWARCWRFPSVSVSGEDA